MIPVVSSFVTDDKDTVIVMVIRGNVMSVVVRSIGHVAIKVAVGMFGILQRERY